MSISRRDFVKTLALLAAGAAALPAQIKAFELYYDANTPRTPGPFIAVDELWLCGLATASMPLRVLLHKEDETPWRLGLNAFGGTICQKAAVDAKLVAVPSAFRWEIIGFHDAMTDDLVRANLSGHISYIDQELVRRTVPINTVTGRLA